MMSSLKNDCFQIKNKYKNERHKSHETEYAISQKHEWELKYITHRCICNSIRLQFMKLLQLIEFGQ